MFQHDVVNAAGDPWQVQDQTTFSFWGDYTFEDATGSETSLRLGVRNFTDEAPPLATTGYLGNMYQPYGRYFYGRVTKSF